MFAAAALLLLPLLPLCFPSHQVGMLLRNKFLAEGTFFFSVLPPSNVIRR
jgi:hypothetical protein